MRSEAVVEAIRQVADDEIMPRFQALADHEIIEKRPGDLVTVADRLAERALADIFRREDPGCLVVGEEGMYADSTPLRQLPTAELAWVIDPVDGTRNFAGGSPDFAVMVAEVRSGVTTRSWIWQPVPEVMFFAELGGGVYRNGERLAVAAPSEPLVGALHGRWGRPRPEESRNVELVRLAGCCGVDYPAVVEGRRAFLGYWSMHPWDHLPGGLMITEQGGVQATIDGQPYGPGVVGRFLLAAANEQAWQVARTVAREQFGR